MPGVPPRIRDARDSNGKKLMKPPIHGKSGRLVGGMGQPEWEARQKAIREGRKYGD